LLVNYSKHAIVQMKDREISDIEIMECLNGWDTRHTDKKGNPVYRKLLSSGRGIKVVTARDDNSFIITVADY